MSTSPHPRDHGKPTGHHQLVHRVILHTLSTVALLGTYFTHLVFTLVVCKILWKKRNPTFAFRNPTFACAGSLCNMPEAYTPHLSIYSIHIVSLLALQCLASWQQLLQFVILPASLPNHTKFGLTKRSGSVAAQHPRAVLAIHMAGVRRRRWRCTSGASTCE